MTQRIMIVDDDKSIVAVIKGYLEQVNYHVIEAYDGENALYLLRRERPDLLILDLFLPGKNGYELTKIIRQDKYLAALPIIMLTARVDDADKIIGLELGADDYITKPFNAREVVARVNAILRRTKLDQISGIRNRILVSKNLRLDMDQHRLYINNELIDLTKTEFNLLETFLENPGYTLTRDDLIEKSMGYAYEGMGRALDTHIRNLRRKIETDPENPEFIQTIYGIGYRFIGENE